MTEYDGLAPYYDVEWKELKEDMPLILEEAKKADGPILELACGSGRVAIPIAEQGQEVWGLDNSGEMLKLFEDKLKNEYKTLQSKIHLSQQNMVDFTLDQTFNLIIIPFNSFLLLTDRREFDKCLSNCHQHLTENGTFYVDIFAPSFELCAIKEPRMQFLKHFYLPDEQKVVIQWENAKRNMARQLIEIDFLYEEYEPSGKVVHKMQNLTMSIMFRYEMQYLLEKNGFEIEGFYGNYDRSAFEIDSPQMIYICKKK